MEPFTPDESPEPLPPPPPTVPIRKRIKLVVELVLLLILMGVILILTSNKVQFEEVVSASMEPTLMVGDVIMNDANAPHNRYDIICFKDPDKTSEDLLVKRIMGLPGDRIIIQDGILSINGHEEYSTALTENKIEWKNDAIRIPENRVYVMGDNRNNSEDSRVFGPVPVERITGVVQLIVWPPSRWGRPRKLH